ncbi:MAG: hypothetical protein DRH17_03925 [Deltaproteobacteria bacterium]|nr:MAG: hypothetical protein DRH17_03925 [Deltaproteobacteria bacterium]
MILSAGDFDYGDTHIFLMKASWQGCLDQRVLLQEWYESFELIPHTSDFRIWAKFLRKMLV